MARLNLRLAENAPGELFVDSTCIDCDTCRQLAPAIFAEGSGASYVRRQPSDEAERLRALMALVACPTASIGAPWKAAEAARAFPERIDGAVHYCGYASEQSFGASSYLVERPAGNVLVDSPRAAGPLLSRLAELGGVRFMFLTHRDDVADHAAFRERFGCERVLHEADVSAATRGVELQRGGADPWPLGPGLTVIPVPGHTRGSCALLVESATSSPATTSGQATTARSRWAAASAGTRGRSSGAACASCSTSASSGSCRDTAGACTCRPPGCGARSNGSSIRPRLWRCPCRRG
jgi:ferredoxin